MKHISSSLLILFSFLGASAEATILVNAPPPFPQHIPGDSGYTLYYAAAIGATLPLPGEFYNASDGYRLIDATSSGANYTSGGLIYLDVSTDAPPTVTGNQEIAVTLGVLSTQGNEIPLTGASVVDISQPNLAPILCNQTSNCLSIIRNGITTYLSAVYSAGTTMRLSFSLADLCATTGVTSNANSSICPADPGNFAGNTMLIQEISVSFSVVDPVASPTPIGNLSTSPFTTTIALTDIPPTITKPPSPNIQDFYSPGDQSIIFPADNYQPTSGVNLNGAPLQSLVILADRTQIPSITGNARPTGYEVSGSIGASGTNSLPGFVNTTAACNVGASTCPNGGYKAAIYSMNVAGIFSTSAAITPFVTGQGDVSADGLLHAEAVNSVLTESKCFIATAAFHDGKAAPVMMLRKFRDEILSKSALGREFIKTYYELSPPLARWVWDKPIIRSVALHALAPVELMAWAILKLAHADDTVSSQPYIDRVKKKLDEENPPPANGNKESYIDSVKKTLSPTPSNSGSYIDQVKKKIPAEDSSSAGYSEKIKKDLPPEEEVESPIAKVKEGRDKPLVPKRGDITSAVGLKFGVSPGVKVTNTKGVVDFQQMYGNGSEWQPDLVLHYERQLFHSENFGSLGLQIDFGISYAEGYGQYQFGFGSTDTKLSKTKFSFVQLPLTVGGVYRFNLFRVMRPYVGASAGSMFYTEIRSDTNPDRRGFTPIYEVQGGLSFLLDFFDKKTSTESFLSEGIQHTYLSVEFMRMDSFAKTGVLFQRNGIYGGVLFEY